MEFYLMRLWIARIKENKEVFHGRLWDTQNIIYLLKWPKNKVINLSLSSKWNYYAWFNVFIYTNKK